MRYDTENGLLELSAEELAGAVSALGLRLGPIAPGRLGGTSAESLRAFEDGLASLSNEARDVLESALGALADPERTLKLHATAGEAWLHRAVYAWAAGSVAMLAARGRTNVLGMSSADDITALLLTPLVAGDAAVAGDVRIELDGRAVLALVGAGDALRYLRMAALVAHAPMPESVTAADVAARLRESMLDDPRWASNLYASVLPFDASVFMDAPTVDLAMARLSEAGLFATTERSGAFPAIYHPTDEGLVVADALANGNGQVAFTLFERRDDDALAYESMLLARGPQMLAGVSIAPEGGGLVALSTAALTSLASRLVGS